MSASARLAVISLDGTPKSLLERFFAEGLMPNLARFAEQADLRELWSVVPTVSAVAWASFMTGRNPAKHGIFGFADLEQGSYKLYFPNCSHLRGRHIWEILSAAGKKVFGMNVPVTYPPRPVNGILIGGFLSPSVEKCAYPHAVVRYLRSVDYRIDAEAAVARESKTRFLSELNVVLERREEAVLHFLGAEQWDFFHAHIMETDRINHFLWRQMEAGPGPLGEGFRRFYRRLDETVGRILEKLGDEAKVMILSDHGFCPIKAEVQLAAFLARRGWIVPAPGKTESLETDLARSRAYCLVPGRIRLNLAGREPDGRVSAGEYESEREKLKRDLLELTDPETGRPVLRGVLEREDVFRAEDGAPAGVDSPAPDLIAVPEDGYDLKLGAAKEELFKTSALEGMHTFGDAFVCTRGVELPEGELDIMRLAGALLAALDVEAPPDMDSDGALHLVRKALGD